MIRNGPLEDDDDESGVSSAGEIGVDTGDGTSNDAVVDVANDGMDCSYTRNGGAIILFAGIVVDVVVLCESVDISIASTMADVSLLVVIGAPSGSWIGASTKGKEAAYRYA